MITIGFTGTRNGMTVEQVKSVTYLLRDVLKRVRAAGDEVLGLHGDCIGADVDFARLCHEHGFEAVCRPCTFENMRAHVSRAIAEPEPPMKRNRAIVADATVMIACPPNDTPIKRGSGTWATIGFSEKAGKPLAICFPDGSIGFKSLGPWCAATHGDQAWEMDESGVSERDSQEEK